MTWYRDQRFDGIKIFLTNVSIIILLQLKQLVACHWKHHFVGAVCYTDDLTLLAPSQENSLSIKCSGRSGIYHRAHTQLSCTALPGYTVPQGSYCTVPSAPLHQWFSVSSCIPLIYVILLLATTPSMRIALSRNISQKTSYVPK